MYKRQTTAGVEVQLSDVPDAARSVLEKLGAVRTSGGVLLWDLRAPDGVNEALALALQQGCKVRAVQPRASALEELVLQANRDADGKGRISP